MEKFSYLDEFDLKRLLLLCSTYMLAVNPEWLDCPMKSILPVSNTMNENHSLINEELTDTKGWLVYHHQLEALYSMASGFGNIAANDFRRNVAKKKPEAIQQLNSLKFSNGQSFRQMMDERLLWESTIFPNYSGAGTLFEYVN